MTRAVAACLLADLEGNRLEVALVPAPQPRHECHAVRVAVSRNPTWYRRLCAAFPSSRRRAKALPDTRIRRRDVLSLLSRLATGRPVRSRYAAEIARIARASGCTGPQAARPIPPPAARRHEMEAEPWPF